MLKRLVLLIALVLIMPTSAQAQEAVRLDSLKVRLWSEYDQPSMLVIHDFKLTDDTAIPASIDLRFPSDANLTAVAYESGGKLLLANYQTKPAEEAGWQVITVFVTERTSYHIEYYQPLKLDGNKRYFIYQWTGDYPVENFDIEIQLPGDSENVKTDPVIPLVQGQTFMSGGAMMKGLDEGQTYQVELTYSRTTEVPVATQSSQVEPIVPVDENTDGRSTLDNLPLLLAVIGVILIIIAGLVYFFRRSTSESKPRQRKRSRSSEGAGEPTYCHECGTRSQEGDRFCRTCGAKLRGG
jgi:hypothetical protein